MTKLSSISKDMAHLLPTRANAVFARAHLTSHRGDCDKAVMLQERVCALVDSATEADRNMRVLATREQNGNVGLFWGTADVDFKFVKRHATQNRANLQGGHAAPPAEPHWADNGPDQNARRLIVWPVPTTVISDNTSNDACVGTMRVMWQACA